MKILEEHTAGKFDDPLRCEDSIFIGDSYIAVIDGVTTKSQRRYEGRTSGRAAAEILSAAFSAMPAEMDAAGLLDRLNQAVISFCSSRDPLPQGNEIPRASVIVYSAFAHEIWSYGDCQYRLHGETVHPESRIDEMNGMLRKYVLDAAIRNGASVQQLLAHDPGREAIRPYLELQCQFENEQGYWGYPVINGSPACMQMLARREVRPGDEVILASDGYPVLLDTLEESEQALAALLQKDPLGILDHPGTKGLYPGQISFDDRCYIRFIA